jgi:hypothetical protein
MVNQCVGLVVLIEQMEATGQTEVVAALKASHEKCVEDNPVLSPENQNFPPVMIQAWNFGSAFVKWLGAGRPVRSKRQIASRLKICKSCPFLENQRCTRCGCYCVETEQLINKLALATEKCPEGKWE